MSGNYTLFIDESGHSTYQKNYNEDSEKFFFLTGILFNDDYYFRNVEPGIKSLKQRYLFENTVIHWTDFRKKCKDKTEKKYTCFCAELTSSLANMDYKLCSIRIDKSKLWGKYRKYSFNPYCYAFEILLERFFYETKNQKECKIRLLAEARGDKPDINLKNYYQNVLQKYGTGEKDKKFLESYEIKNRFSSELKTVRKIYNNNGLQLADVNCYYASKSFDVNYKPEHNFDSLIMNEVSKHFMRSKGGGINGYGKISLP